MRPRSRWTLVLVLLALAAALAACGTDSSDESDATAGGEGEVFLEPAGSTGPAPFTGSVAGTAPAPPKLDGDPSSGTTTGGGTPVASQTGTTDELYGGSGELQVCDTGQLVAFLNENPDKRAAWAGVLGIPSTEEAVAAYVDGLAPVVLRADTRVTNHGFAEGAATPRQSILEAGTAVLVDANGVPRVRCACGNPLTEPVPVETGPAYTGTRWDDFDPERVLVVVPAPPVSVLVVVNVSGPGTLEVPVGATAPAGATSPSAPTTPEPAPTTPTEAEEPAGGTITEGEPSGGDYTSCARRYGEAIRDLTIAGIPPDPSWPADAQRAAEAARAGDLDRALEICEENVADIEEALAGG